MQPSKMKNDYPIEDMHPKYFSPQKKKSKVFKEDEWLFSNVKKIRVMQSDGQQYERLFESGGVQY